MNDTRADIIHNKCYPKLLSDIRSKNFSSRTL